MPILDDCKSLLKSFDHVLCAHVPRNYNGVANYLAKFRVGLNGSISPSYGWSLSLIYKDFVFIQKEKVLLV